MYFKKEITSPKTIKFSIMSDDDKEISWAYVYSQYFRKEDRKQINFPTKGEIYYIASFCTVDEERNKGYGRKLMNHLLEQIKGHFAWLIVCSTGEMTNHQLVEYYKSFGFEEHYEKKGSYSGLPWLTIKNGSL